MTRQLTVRRTLAAAAIAPLLATGLVACGDGGSGSSSAADSTAQVALSSDLAEGDTVDPDEFVKTVTDGVEASTTAHLTMKVSAGTSGTMTAEGDVDYTSAPPSLAMTMSMPVGGGEMDIRLVDGIVYLSMGQLTQGKFWKIDPSNAKGPLASLGMDKMMDRMDPAKVLGSMKDGISKVTYVGAQDGLHHYELTIDTKKMLDATGADVPRSAQSQLPDTVTYDLWLDEQNRLTKMTMGDLPMGGGGSMELNVSDWGKDVDIEAPPAGQVTEMPDLGSMMQGMTGSPVA